MLREAEALKRVTDGRFDFPPLELVSTERKPTGTSEGRPDLVLEFRWRERTQRFLAEYESLSTPRRLKQALALVREYTVENGRPMVMAPYLDEEWLDRLAEEGVSGLDFSGNGVVVVPGCWFVYRTGRPNAFPSSKYIQDIYRGRSSFVARTLLVRSRYDQVTELREEIVERGGTISLSTVSKVLSRLEDELLISREEGVKLLQPEQLLDRLAGDYRGPEVRRRTAGRVPDLRAGLRAALDSADQENFALLGKADGTYASFPGSEETVTLFTDDMDALLSVLEVKEDRRFPDVEILETTAETVYFDARRRDGFAWTSPVETYLQLAGGGKREQEVAEKLRGDLLSQAFD